MNRWSAALAILLAAFNVTSLASTLEELEQTAEQFDSLENDLFKLRERLLSERTIEPSAKNFSYDVLTSCGDVLTSSNRAIAAMTQVLHMSQFVWDPKARELAKPYIDIQVRALVRRLNSSADYLEKILHRSGNDQVASVCLRARDLIRASVPVAMALQPAWRAPQ